MGINRPEPGPGYAFFDVDDTLLGLNTMVSFQDYWYRMMGEPRKSYDDEMARLMAQRVPRERLHRRYYAHFAGRNVTLLDHCARAWFDDMEQAVPHFYHGPVVDALRRHQDHGVEPVFVSGSFPAVLLPLARRLGVRRLLVTRLEVRGGCYTGQVLAPQPIGRGKAEVISDFLSDAGATASICHAYGDHISDLPMLSAVGFPTVVAGDPPLEAHAAQAGWPILPKAG